MVWLDKCIRTNLNHWPTLLSVPLSLLLLLSSHLFYRNKQQHLASTIASTAATATAISIREVWMKDAHINHICTGCYQKKILLNDRYKYGNKRIRKILLHMRFGLVWFVSHLISMSVATTMSSSSFVPIKWSHSFVVDTQFTIGHAY